MPKLTVKQGDCVSSVACQFGIDARTVWNHPRNSELKNKRKSINLLLPGDVLFVPDRELKEISGSTESRHKFVRKGVPAKLRVRLLQKATVKADEPYTLNIDGKLIFGNTDQDGWITQVIPPDSRLAVLSLKDGREQYRLHLGHLDPIDQTTGIQARLKSLGYYKGALNGEVSPHLAEAIRLFQKDKGINETGKANAETQEALGNEYGS